MLGRHDDGTKMQDLYLLDTVLCLMLKDSDWAELEQRYFGTQQAIKRLREAFESGEMKILTQSLANYFRTTGSTQP